jgi:putative heme-binding domain-containing protein
VPLKAAGSSYSGKHEVFAEATGTSGFAPTALAVHPTPGELFVSIGGRGTRGGVYRITHDKANADPKPLPMAKRSLDFDAEQAKQWLADCLSDNAGKRRVALEMSLRWWDKADWGKKLTDAVKPNLSHEDQLIRRAAGRIGSFWHIDLGNITNPQAKLTLALEQTTDDPDWALKVALVALDPDSSQTELLTALRVIQLVYGDLTAKDAVGTVWEGYTFRWSVTRDQADKLRAGLSKLNRASTGAARKREVELEVARMFAAISAMEKRDALQATLRRTDKDTPQADDFHYLIALARMSDGGSWNGAAEVVDPLLGLFRKVKTQDILLDRHWPLRFQEMVGRFPRNWNKFHATLFDDPDFGRPEHIVFVRGLGDASVAARKFLAAAEKDKDYPWTPAVVEFLNELPAQDTYKTLQKLWDRPGLEDAVIRALARQPRAADRLKFTVGLKSLDPELVRISARALALLPPDAKSEIYIQSVKALRRFPDDKPHAAVRTELVALLQKYSGEKIGADAKAWATWVVKCDPATEKPLNASDGFDAAAWGNRLAGIDWTKGAAGRGRVTFTKATCAACHDGGSAVGPSLLGISKRFGRDDLLTAILQPSKDVSPRYRPTRVVTTDEKAYTGIIVYEATDGVILQTGADTTVRIAGANIASRKQVEISLMPTGLIDKLSDAEIADLLAYLATLGDPKPK